MMDAPLGITGAMVLCVRYNYLIKTFVRREKILQLFFNADLLSQIALCFDHLELET